MEYLLKVKLRGRRERKKRRKRERFVPAITGDLAIVARTRGLADGERESKKLQTNNLLRNLCSSIHRTQNKFVKTSNRRLQADHYLTQVSTNQPRFLPRISRRRRIIGKH